MFFDYIFKSCLKHLSVSFHSLLSIKGHILPLLCISSKFLMYLRHHGCYNVENVDYFFLLCKRRWILVWKAAYLPEECLVRSGI